MLGEKFPLCKGYYASYVGHLLKLEILPDMVVDKQQYRLRWLRMWVASVGLKSCSIGTIVAP